MSENVRKADVRILFEPFYKISNRLIFSGFYGILKSMSESIPKKSVDMVATKSMLDSLRGELKSDYTETKMELRAIHSKMESHDSNFDSLESKMGSHNLRFDSFELTLKSETAKIFSAIHRVTALVEEQNNKNNYVLDQNTSINDRLDRLEKNVSELRKDFDEFPKIIKRLTN